MPFIITVRTKGDFAYLPEFTLDVKFPLQIIKHLKN